MGVDPIFPSRLQSFEQCQIKTPLWLSLMLGRGLAPTRVEYEKLGRSLSHGDLQMDALIESTFEHGCVSEVFAQLNKQASSRSVVGFPCVTRLEFESLIAHAEQPPFVVDWKLADEGAKFIHRTGTLATDVLRDMALMGGYLLASFNQTLVLTGEFERGAAARLGNTARWWLAVTQAGSNQTSGLGVQATLRVRWVHAMVRRHLKAHSQWDSQRHGLPINQADMAATYLGFSSVMLLGLRKSGIFVSPTQSRGVMHLWKIIAWQMGVASEWLVDTEAEAAVFFRHLMMTHTPPDDTSKRLAQALAQEPLLRQYGALQAARRRWAYWSHLSSSDWLLGGAVLEKLGLTSPAGPWLKAAESLPRAAAFYVLSPLPAFRQHSVSSGRAAQCRAVERIALIGG